MYTLHKFRTGFTNDEGAALSYLTLQICLMEECSIMYGRLRGAVNSSVISRDYGSEAVFEF